MKLDIFDFGVEDTHFNYLKVFPKGYQIRLFEAFAGIGCQRMALDRLGVLYECVGISEIDKYAIKSYNAIHGYTMNYGDICEMESIPPCDIFTWSFPCTDLSKAGKQKGLVGTRSGLVYEVLRLLKATEQMPKVLIMENVPDLVQEKFKAQFYEIQKEIESYGYKNFTRILNAKDYGVAQNRERVFMVSILGDYHYEFAIPFPLELRLKDYLEESVDEKYYLSEKMLSFFVENTQVNQDKGNGFRFKPKSSEDTASAITTLAGNRMDDNFVEEYIGVGVHPNSKKMEFNGFHDTVCPTLLATDYKAPKCIQVAQIEGKGLTEMTGRVYSSKGLSPTIKTMGGGNTEPKIVELGNYSPSNHNASIIVDKEGVAPTVKENHGTVTAITTSFMPSIVVAGQFQAADRDYNKNGKEREERFELRSDELANAVLTKSQKNCVAEPSIVQKGHGFNLGGNKGDIVSSITTSAWEHNNHISNGLRIRKLTPLECWRLMGISDDDFAKAQAVCSNSQLYKQAGNGIVVDVFANILKGLIEV